MRWITSSRWSLTSRTNSNVKKSGRKSNPTRQLLNKILKPHMIKPDVSDPQGNTLTLTRTARKPQIHHTPQLIPSTVTFRNHHNRFLFQECGWLTCGDTHLVKINGARGKTEMFASLPSSTHPVLVVKEESDIHNIGGAKTTQTHDEGEAVLYEAVTGEPPGDNFWE